MALGGGTFLTQNKKLNGTYINFVSVARATASLGDRGYAALPIPLDWGVDGEVFTVTQSDLQKNCQSIFGYDYTHEKLKGIRDLFKNIHTAFFYKLMKNGVAASNVYGTARHKGVRGNDLTTVVQPNVDSPEKMDVLTYLDSNLVDEQTVEPSTNHLQDNDFVVWKRDVDLMATAGTPFTLGANGEPVEGAEHQEALTALESYTFNAIGCLSSVETVKNLYIEFTKRLRDQVGVKFQCIVHKEKADYEGVISVKNNVLDDENVTSMVFWTTGAAAGCPINKSNTNKKYDGEFIVDTKFSQPELEVASKGGEFTFHQVGDEVRVLDDINTFTSFTVEKNEDFNSNQTIRLLDQIGNDIAVLFNTKYLGQVPNDRAGQIALWNDITKHHQELQKLRALEDFTPDDVTVSKGETKKSVVVTDYVTPVNAMAQLYMTVMVA
ncbi:phage tail sheath family protein [Sporosarcina sp. Te-1]|uniref:phage tail sheath family protein n=1 Tax=Sporosarcina sp. Te-1 TaxID=2818390 RepID=UPI001A9F8624|nr:phage tail sheath family protein [Sporosarcina sp. Te-1]QTD40646.1 phage tail sheath family protein [Sporosarcina sp. Te-1]